MERKYKLLFKIQLYSLFDINRLLHSHDKKEKKRTLCFGAVGLAIIGMLREFEIFSVNSVLL